MLFIDTPVLTVNALGGSDEIAVQSAGRRTGAVWDVELTLDGGLPTGSDTVISGTPGSTRSSTRPPAPTAGRCIIDDRRSADR